MSFAAKVGKALADPVVKLAESEPEMLGKIFLGLGSISAAAIGYYVTQYNENLKKLQEETRELKEGMITFANDMQREKTMSDLKENLSTLKLEIKENASTLKSEIREKLMDAKLSYNNEIFSIKTQVNDLATSCSRLQEEQTKFLQNLGNDYI